MSDRADVIQEALEKELRESRLGEFVPLDEESQKRIAMRERCRELQREIIEGRDYS